MFSVLVILCLLSSQLEAQETTEIPTTAPISDEDFFPDVFNSTDDYIVVTLPPNATTDRNPDTKQIAFPHDREDASDKRRPCKCKGGLCACCTGMLMQTLQTKGCMNLRYIPEDFAFHFEMKMNDMTLYKNRISGKNPPPICINPPRIGFIEVCANFYDIYFVGRNMHVCMEMGGYFQGFELFTRSFDCLRMGDKGVKVMKPEDDSFRPQTGGNLEAEVDAGDDIEDYDENVVRRFDKN
ncbi:uncharacterized protein LOC132260292 [Phlebotomus argentipes]|uniref:uncharacterized protein LOC132260292 n=1 Tax=Phlebotomus argentipes TaxID=94469 RepID=UPI002892F57F|nr:uncharacterized protein LOC132260292 [Phlebotomus argentipes]